MAIWNMIAATAIKKVGKGAIKKRLEKVSATKNKQLEEQFATTRLIANRSVT